MKNRFIQAYQQAPWRTQLQWIGFFLLGLVIIVTVAGLYLSITAQSTTAGVEIKELELEKETLDRQIADLKTQLAIITSAKVMKDRAERSGIYSRRSIPGGVRGCPWLYRTPAGNCGTARPTGRSIQITDRCCLPSIPLGMVV